MLESEVALYSFFISLFWGATNPLIKKSTEGIVQVQDRNPVRKFFNEIKYLIGNWTYIFLFIINQFGSVLYFVLLQNVDLSLIVPTVNALTFIVTSFVGSLIGENTPSFRSFSGVVLILLGITLCVFDKVKEPTVLEE